MTPQYFAARWSRSVWIVTLAVIALIALINGGMISTAVAATSSARWLLLTGALVMPIILAIVAVFTPRGYAVLPSGIVIHRVVGDLRILYEQVGEVRRIESGDVGAVVRVCGSGGFFGWFGRFRGSRIGWFRAYCSRQDNLVLIERTDGVKILISPAPADAFVDAVRVARQYPA